MKIQPLYDLQQDINRLFIAGSKFAKNDPRLLKQIPVFKKLGEKAPVFKKLATDIEALAEAPATDSAEKLTAISSLLYSILYTQGETTEEGEIEEKHLPVFNLAETNTTRSYIELAPVIKALSESNSGRLEILTDAHKRGVFQDFRTYQYLDLALGDKYTELAEYVEQIIAEIGKPIIPFLLDSFSYEGRSEDVRRLRLLDKFSHEGLNDMITKILGEKSASLQAAAVYILGHDAKNEELIIQLADDKNKLVREASYDALAQIGTENSLRKLKDVYLKNKNKGNLQGIVSAIANSRLPFFFQEIFDQVHLCFKETIELTKDTDDKVLTAAFDKLYTNLEALREKDQPQVYEFLTEILLSKPYNTLITSKKSLLSHTADHISERITTCIESFNLTRQLSFYKSVTKDMPDYQWKSAIYRSYLELCIKDKCSKEFIYDEFIDAYNKGLISLDNLINVYSESTVGYYSNPSNIIAPENIDKRWVDCLFDKFKTFKKVDSEGYQILRFLNVCEPIDSKRLQELLKTYSTKVEVHGIATIFEMMIERNVPNKFELIYDITSKYKQGSGRYYFYSLYHADFWKKFPKEYASRYRKLHEKEKLDLFKEIADRIDDID